MDRHAGKIVINRMTSQRERPRRALEPGYAGVDERPLPQLLDFAVKVAGLVNYHAPSNQKDGDWSDFFLDDPAMVLASIAAVDVGALETAYHRQERRTLEAREEQGKIELFGEMFASVLGLARLFDRWLSGVGHASASAPSTVVRQALEAAIEGPLGEQLRQLAGYGEGAGREAALGTTIAVDCAGFSPRWRAGDGAVDGSIYRGHGRRQRIDHAVPALGPIFNAFLQELIGLQDLAQSHLDAVLGAGDHPPHLALYIAFARLFQTAQGTLNELSSRYVDFYYRDVLRATPRGPVGDRLHLTFTLAASKEISSAIVPAGSRFSAGKDAQGVEIVYASEKDLRVSAARLGRLRALRITRGPLLSGGSSGDDGAARLVHRVLATEITPGGAAFAAFGAADETTTDTELTVPATLGFAIASPYLLLGGGQRNLEIWIRCSDASMRALRPRLDALSAVTGLPPVDLFRDLLARAFDLHLTTAAGWIKVDSYEILAEDDVLFNPELALLIVLPPTWPGVALIDPSRVAVSLGGDPAATSKAVLDATSPSSTLPTLKAYLRQDPLRFDGEPGTAEVSIHPLSLLDGLEAEAIWVRTEVNGLSDLALSNPGGQIKSKKPFFVFGGAPGVQSYLDIHHPEIFAKQIESLGVRIDWFSLPLGEAGFAGHYRDYTVGLDGVRVPVLIDNQSFRVSLGVTNPGAWDLGSDSADLPLFRTESSAEPPEPDPRGTLTTTTTFDLLVPLPETPPPYYDGSKSALRITLIAPPEAFGDSVYAQNVLAAVVESAPALALDPEPPPPGSPSKPRELRYPSVPWLPQAERVSLGYTALGLVAGVAPPSAAGAEPTGSELFHLLPFGGFRRLEAEAAGAATLLPTFAHEGNLLLGFTGLRGPESLTLLLHLASAGDAVSTELPVVAWEHLSGNAWIPFAASRIHADETGGLRRTGALTLDVPALDATTGTVLSEDLRWIRASVAGGAERFPGVIGIHPNTVLARWQDDGNTGEHLRLPRPPGSVKGSIDKLAGIKSVDQPMPSSGGRPPETLKTLPVRLGERLRHKERAIVGWDYERLVLERFPAIDRVRTLPARHPRSGVAPGEVTVVVLPGLDATPGLDPTAPALDTDGLAEIASDLAESASPFVQIHVVNPVYVRIKVTATIEPAEGEDPSLCIRRLNDALVLALSPWLVEAPWAAAGQEYPTEDDLAELARTRPYVASLVDFSCEYSPDPADLAWYFLISASEHALQIAAPAATAPTKGY